VNGDVQLRQTEDGGDITVQGGIVTFSGGLDTAAYLSLFGGSEQYWGNALEQSASRRLISETQATLEALPLRAASIPRVAEAARRDLQWLLDENIASSVEVNVRVPGLNEVCISIAIEAQGRESEFEFTENWKIET